MSYSYAEEKPKVFTYEGAIMLLSIRQNLDKMLKTSGAVRMGEAISGTCGDTFRMLACVDFLVELGEIREIPQGGYVAGQHRIFVRARE